VKPDVPLYTPSMRPSCDAGVSFGCGAAAAPGCEVDSTVVGDDSPVASVGADAAAAVDEDAADADVAPVDAVDVSSSPHAVATRHTAVTPPTIRNTLFMTPHFV
jgi:hypothetical protein